MLLYSCTLLAAPQLADELAHTLAASRSCHCSRGSFILIAVQVLLQASRLAMAQQYAAVAMWAAAIAALIAVLGLGQRCSDTAHEPDLFESDALTVVPDGG